MSEKQSSSGDPKPPTALNYSPSGGKRPFSFLRMLGLLFLVLLGIGLLILGICTIAVLHS